MDLYRVLPLQTCHIKRQCDLSTALKIKETKLQIKLISYKTKTQHQSFSYSVLKRARSSSVNDNSVSISILIIRIYLLPDGVWKLVWLKFTISNRASCTSSTTSSRLHSCDRVTWIIKIEHSETAAYEYSNLFTLTSICFHNLQELKYNITTSYKLMHLQLHSRKC